MTDKLVLVPGGVAIKDAAFLRGMALGYEADESEHSRLGAARLREIADHIEAAEQSLSEAREALEVSETALKDWLHDYAPDLCRAEEVAAARARIAEKGTIAYIATALSAIRALKSSTERKA